MRKVVATAASFAAALGTALVLHTVPAEAESACQVDSGAPVSVGSTGSTTEACASTGSVDGTATVANDGSYASVDGEPTSLPSGTGSGYVAVDGTGPSGCWTGEYEPGGENNSLLASPDPESDCAPQAPNY